MLAWLALGLLGAGFCAGLAYVMTLLLKTVADGWIIGGFAVVGFIPGLFGACGQRFVGLLGFAGILAGMLWGFADAIIRKGAIWQAFVYIDILQAFFVALAVGLLIQVFIKPKPANLTIKKPMPSQTQKPRPAKKSRSKGKDLPIDESRLYEV